MPWTLTVHGILMRTAELCLELFKALEVSSFIWKVMVIGISSGTVGRASTVARFVKTNLAVALGRFITPLSVYGGTPLPVSIFSKFTKLKVFYVEDHLVQGIVLLIVEELN